MYLLISSRTISLSVLAPFLPFLLFLFFSLYVDKNQLVKIHKNYCWYPLPPFNHLFHLLSILRLLRGPTLNHLISIDSSVVRRGSLWITLSDTPVTQKMPRILRALFQEPGTKTKYIFSLYHKNIQWKAAIRNERKGPPWWHSD